MLWRNRNRSRLKSTEPTSAERAWHYALKLLAARDYTVARLREKLVLKAFSEEHADEVIIRLETGGWVSDRRFAERFAESAVSSGRFYGLRLRQEMRRRGVPAELVDEIMKRVHEGHDEVDELRSVIVRRYPGFDFSVAADKEKRRVVSWLQRRGFGMSAIMRALREPA